MPEQLLLLITILIAVGFDFTNGFHDTANAIATSVSTRAMSPRVAVLIAAVLNLAGAVITVVFFQAKVSNTIGKIVAFRAGLVVIIAALIGAIIWNLITWYLGLPSSSTHALVGALSGAAIAAAHGAGGVRASEFWKTVLSLVISPPVGFILAAVVMTLLLIMVHGSRPVPLNRTFRNLQIVTAALVSYSHGANDAQKTMAVITLALVATGHLQTFQVPVWVVLLSASAIAFGTYAGGWRIIKTLGWRIYKLDPATGFAAQLTGAAVIQFATQFGLPVSTTHVVTGSVMGAGASQRLSALRWGVGANIVLAWVLTIPAAGLMAWVLYAILNTAGLRG
jgi:PiT family inorganic phosphate transporter